MGYEEFIKSLKTGEIIDYKNPDCIDCNDCCTMLAAINTREYFNLKRFLNSEKGRIIYNKAYKRMVDYIQKNNVIYMVCPFTDLETKRCDIYEQRPEICKDFHCSKIPDKKFTNYNLTIGHVMKGLK